MPGSASSWTHRPEDLITRLRSASSSTTENGEAKLKVLRELKNQIIGNRTKKLSYIKLGAVPSVVSILSHAAAASQQAAQADVEVDSLLVQSAAAIGSFACGVDVGVKAVLDAGAFPHLLSLISHPNDKVVDAGARSLKIIYQSELAPKYDFVEEKNMRFLISLLNSENENVTELGASIIAHSCQTSIEQKALCDAGVLKNLLSLLEGSVSRRDASLESLATIVKGNPDIISEFVGLENGRTMNTLIELTKDKFPRTRLLACVVLIVIRNTSPLYLQSVGIKTKLILILLELLDDPNQVGDEAAFALSSFIGEDEDLQKLAFEANVVDKLCDHLQRDSLQPKRLQGLYLALAGMCSSLECCRSTLLKSSEQALKYVTNGLTHDAAEVRSAASICLRSISRSVKYLSAGHFMTENVLNPLIQLLYDTSTGVQIAALGAISNIVVDFKMHKLAFMQCGGVKQLVQLSKSMDSTVRLNAVWALRNLMFLVDSRCKDGIYLELTSSTLTSLICDPNPSVQEQALALVRNLVDGPVDSIEYVIAEDGLLLHTVGRQLRSSSKPEVLIQGMYVLCNVASGNEFHKDAVMHQILPQSASGNQSFMIMILQNNDGRLRTAAVWTLVNLTSPTHTGAFTRVVKLRNAGIFSQLKSMVNDPCLDVKLRARTALGQSLTFGDGST